MCMYIFICHIRGVSQRGWEALRHQALHATNPSSSLLKKVIGRQDPLGGS